MKRVPMPAASLRFTESTSALEPSCRNTAALALAVVRDGVITGAAAERSDDGRFDDLLAKAVVHHAASASGLPVPPRTVALSPKTAIESWAPTRAAGVNKDVLEWIASQMRGKRRSNRTLMRQIATIVGAAALPLAQLPN